MNAENFSTYLAQPAKLYQLPYQEIKNLVAEYPYSANLRRLLLLKSKIEHDPKFEQFLHDLASSTLDRQHLYEFVTSEIPQLLDLETEPEERLELQDLAEMREKDKILLTAEEELPASLQASTITPVTPPEAESFPGVEDELGTAEEDLLPQTEEQPEQIPDTAIVFEFESPLVQGKVDTPQVEEVSDNAEAVPEPGPTPEPAPAPVVNQEEVPPVLPPAAAPIIDDIENPVYRVPAGVITTLIAGSLLQAATYQPQPSSNFQSWHTRHEAKQRDWKSLRRGIIQSSPKQKAKEVAKQSVQDPTNLASETLAKLLARQGQYRKAVKIYQRLSLLYPEKSRYFAATIEELKQKI